ncbi:MAG: nucleotide pyrophosphohydrolase [Elusimicrobia bacterium]|nr:nucleotide pyrophosphohydrolase [Elusimicrobiota bacterium]
MKELAALKAAVRRFAKARDWDQFHTPKNLAMAMSVEASEVAEIFQWLTAAQSARLKPSAREALADELADVYIYLLRLADKTGIDLLAASRAKMKKNALKYPVGKSRGLAKKYTEL